MQAHKTDHFAYSSQNSQMLKRVTRIGYLIHSTWTCESRSIHECWLDWDPKQIEDLLQVVVLWLVEIFISWKSLKQLVTGKSSVEAEYWVTAHGCCELSWLRILLEVGFKQDGPTSLHCNSISAIKIAKNPYHEKTKYVGADCHFIKEKNREKMWC